MFRLNIAIVTVLAQSQTLLSQKSGGVPDQNIYNWFTYQQNHACDSIGSSDKANCGQLNWKDMKQPNVCGNHGATSKQSPKPFNNYSTSAWSSADEIVFSKSSSSIGTNMDFVTNGHSWQVDYSGNSLTFTKGGVKYEFLQFHIHRLSEHVLPTKSHTKDWKYSHAEVHFVFKVAKTDELKCPAGQSLIVIGQHLEVDDAKAKKEPKAVQDWVRTVFADSQFPHIPNDGANVKNPKGAPAAVEKKAFKADILQLVGDINHGYYTYHGSLTTPPCSETVNWIVRSEPKYISKASFDIFTKSLGQIPKPFNQMNENCNGYFDTNHKPNGFDTQVGCSARYMQNGNQQIVSLKKQAKSTTESNIIA